MHQLFIVVLGQRDLSRAGDLFSLEDTEIEDCLSEALQQIKEISSSPDYLRNDNDQAVVEICITRITTAIRKTKSIEKHGKALVELWESCLEHNLKPVSKDEDTPHAKIVSDIMSCIFQNYNNPAVMALAVPVAVKFLQMDNKELSRNMSNYLALAATGKPEILAKHTATIVNNILQGNSLLLHVLPSVYEKQPEPINSHITELVQLMPQLEPSEQQHLLRLLQVITKQCPQEVQRPSRSATKSSLPSLLKVLNESIPTLITQLKDPLYSEYIINMLVDLAAFHQSILDNSIENLKEIAENYPNLLGQIAKIFGIIGCINEEKARSCLVYLVTQLANMEHCFHHILLLEIKKITDTFGNILGAQSKDIYCMSNSFTAIAKLLVKHLEKDIAASERTETNTVKEAAADSYNNEAMISGTPGVQTLQIKRRAFERKMTNEGNNASRVRRHSLGQASREEWKAMRFNRSKSLALHVMYTKSISSENEDGENGNIKTDITFSDRSLSEGSVKQPLSPELDEHQLLSLSNFDITPTETRNSCDIINGNCQQRNTEILKCGMEEQDQLYMHLKASIDEVKAFYSEMVKRIPVPDQCIIEDSVRRCVAKLLFSCPHKGFYCLYSKSSFTLNSEQPQLWIYIMFLFQQSCSANPLSSQDESVQILKALWEKTQLKGTHSFETAMIQTIHYKKDLDSLQRHLEDVRFFDLFGYSEEAGVWQCFMCNNPEKATVVNQDGQPLIEGKLKEKQVRWKFIKRWKTRYFTLAGNQLLFSKGKSKDDPDECPIELSKVQSVKIITKKRRDRSLPRAFEIFTDNKTYVFKAKDEKNAEEWLQCINVAVAQAKQRESREATTYL
ncbi:ventricular zone-expressed PH domain-containing protein isoform X2 [Stegostoma tigrinum]|uniref:ventricular zone-expressed PH domain-containing protein isoform X2 n=1 Tax=Stegostoma tigrinum TaxID=3053191 RepID=UPI00202B5451|nr:ventricular zone-expressed PH domain-containing protein isoform X2 [Stegostoma tigrinum]